MPKTTSSLRLSLFSGILLSVSWYWHLTVFVFFAFVPLLILEDRISQLNNLSKPRLKLFWFTYLSFLLWNILATWWVVYASFAGACIAFVFNALFMALTFVIFSAIKNKIGKPWATWLLIPVWIAWEYGHTLWDLSWTWLTLGNVFAFNHHWVQWYEYTGTSGGTLWALVSNIFIFQVIRDNSSLKLVSRPVIKMAAMIILPVLFSYVILFAKKKSFAHDQAVKVVVAQPNIDPYNVKFVMDYQSQFQKMLNLVRPVITAETDYLVLPETFITDNMDEASIGQNEDIRWFRDSLLAKFPQLKIVVGANTYAVYPDEKNLSATARKDSRDGTYYDVFNTALQIDRDGLQIYHKSKLVPGVERMPFPALLKPLESLALDLGGTMGSLGVQAERTLLTDSYRHLRVAPVVCYESVYADYLGEYLRKGADLIFIITNDGWWDKTPGYVQHLNYARLRAIESRRQIARSANTGISCFLDEFGNTTDETEWWQEAVIQKDIYAHQDLTFFSRFGDLISYVCSALSILLLVWLVFLRFRK